MMSLDRFCDCLQCLIQSFYFPYLLVLFLIILDIFIIVNCQFTNYIIFLLILFLRYHQLFQSLRFKSIELSFILFEFSLKGNFLNFELLNLLN